MDVSLRKYPYPYEAMMAICSDLDETPSSEIYFETARYLNTTDQTMLGKGVGLEVGNTIYFDMPKGQFSYTNTSDLGRIKIHQLIDSGHIDCFHSFGDFVTERAQIERYWSVIQSGQRKIEVWVDHGQAITNLDNDIMQGEGAIVGANAYHCDLTIQSGVIPFVWKGRVTSIVAQNSPRSYQGIINWSEFIASGKTLALEFVKGVLARLGNKKYAMHKDNKVLRQTTLLDDTPVFEFMRCNPSWGGVSHSDTGRGVHQVLTKKVLDTLLRNEGCSIFYSHLGKVHSESAPFTDQTRSAFELLARYKDEKRILVATTRRLLGYLRAQQEVVVHTEMLNQTLHIFITTDLDIAELQGLTWYIGDVDDVQVFINNREQKDIQINQPDQRGFRSVSLPWHLLQFPNLQSNYEFSIK